MGFFKKTFRKLKRTVKKVTRKVVKPLVRAGLAVSTGGASEVLYAGKKTMDAQAEAMKDLGQAMNQPVPQVADYATAEARADAAERKRRRVGRSAGRRSTLLAGSTLGNLSGVGIARNTLLGG